MAERWPARRLEYVCLNLDSGRAMRMPPEFTAAYVAST